MDAASAARRVAIVGDDDPTFVEDLRAALQEGGIRSRVLTASTLRKASRTPDLTLVLGDAAQDGGLAVVDEVGADRGPYAVLLPQGSLAVRLEARKRGLTVIPRAEDGAVVAREIERVLSGYWGQTEVSRPDTEVGTTLGALLETVEERVADALGRPHLDGLDLDPAVEERVEALVGQLVERVAQVIAAPDGAPVDDLDWDEDPETEQRPSLAGAPAPEPDDPSPEPGGARAKTPGLGRPSSPAGPTRRATLQGIDALASSQETTTPGEDPPPTGPADREQETRAVRNPLAPLYDDETKDAPASYRLLASADPDATAPHRPIAKQASVRQPTSAPPDRVDGEPDPSDDDEEAPLPLARAVRPPASPPRPPSSPPPGVRPIAKSARRAAPPARPFAPKAPPLPRIPGAPAAGPSSRPPPPATPPPRPEPTSSAPPAASPASPSPAPSPPVPAGSLPTSDSVRPRVAPPEAIAAAEPEGGGVGFTGALVVGGLILVAGLGLAAWLIFFDEPEVDPGARPGVEAPRDVTPPAPVEPEPPDPEGATPAATDDDATGDGASDDPSADDASGAGAEGPPSGGASAEAASLDPRAARARSDELVEEGRGHLRAGRLEEARRSLEEAAAIHDRNPHAHEWLARLALETGDAEAAVGHAERAADLRRLRGRYHLLVGDARRAAGDEPGARRAYERAVALDPEDEDARARLGGG